MAIETQKKLVLKRVPPGDQWTDANGPSEIFESLTDGLEYVFQKSKGSITEFHLSAFKGEIFRLLILRFQILNQQSKGGLCMVKKLTNNRRLICQKI